MSINLVNDCESIECNQIMCEPSYILQRVEGFCCPICQCKPCDQIDLKIICSKGFKAVRNSKHDNECCHTYSCLPDNKDTDLFFEIQNIDVNRSHKNKHK